MLRTASLVALPPALRTAAGRLLVLKNSSGTARGSRHVTVKWSVAIEQKGREGLADEGGFATCFGDSPQLRHRRRLSIGGYKLFLVEFQHLWERARILRHGGWFEELPFLNCSVYEVRAVQRPYFLDGRPIFMCDIRSLIPIRLLLMTVICRGSWSTFLEYNYTRKSDSKHAR